MNKIRPWLAVGGYRDTRDLGQLQAEGIGAMLQLADSVPQPGITALYLPIADGVALPDGTLERGINFIREQHASGQAILVACGAGVSRSVTFALAALKEIEGVPLMEGMRQMREVHPLALPHQALWESLCEAYPDEKVSWLAMWQELHL